jgi:hypothetical protein
LAFGAPSGGLIDIPITFLLKNKLHLKAHELADFRLVSAIPLYLSFVFGFIRHAETCLQLCACEPGPRYQGAAGVPWTQKHSAHSSLY